jgi:hypothetical protein
LGDEASLVRERDGLFSEAESAGDALTVLLHRGERLRLASIPRDERSAEAKALLALDDPQAFAAAKPALADKGASFDGVRIPDEDRGAYSIALDLAACAHHGTCRDADSTRSHMDCARHGQCEYLATFAAMQRYLPPWHQERVSHYYERVRDRLSRRDFEAFGLP